LARQVPAADEININLPDQSSGMLEVRLVLVGRDATEPRSWFSQWIDVEGPRLPPTAEVVAAEPGAADTLLRLSAPGADSIELLHHDQSVVRIDGDEGTAQLRTGQWGSGPVRLRAVARYGDQPVAGQALVVELAD
jgi:hypothetical protein